MRMKWGFFKALECQFVSERAEQTKDLKTTLFLWNLLGMIGRWTRVKCPLSLRNKPIEPQHLDLLFDFSPLQKHWGKDDPEIAGQSTGRWNDPRTVGWMEKGVLLRRSFFFADVFWRAYFIHHDLHGADFWSLPPTGQTHELSTRSCLVVAELSTWNLSFFWKYFLLESIKPPFGNFQSTLEPLGNLTDFAKRCMPMQTSPPMVPARLERGVRKPDPNVELFFFGEFRGLLSFTLYHLVKWEFLYIANVLQIYDTLYAQICVYRQVHTYTGTCSSITVAATLPSPKIDDWSFKPMDEEINTSECLEFQKKMGTKGFLVSFWMSHFRFS